MLTLSLLLSHRPDLSEKTFMTVIPFMAVFFLFLNFERFESFAIISRFSFFHFCNKLFSVI